MKEIEIQVEERVEFERKKVKQSFIFNDKDKNTRFLLDNRYILNNKFHDFIVKENLGGDEYQFVEEEDLKDRIVLHFIILNGEGNSLNNYSTWRTFADKVPDNCGCEFCVFKEKLNDDFFRCLKKEKSLHKDVKKCINFKQRDLRYEN